RTRLPGTIPPPSTRLSSPQPRRRRGASSVVISLSGIGRAASCGRAFAESFAFLTWNSWSVFHALQCGHWPDQRRLSPPQSVQTKVMGDLGIGGLGTHDGVFTSAGVSLCAVSAFHLVSVKAPP